MKVFSQNFVCCARRMTAFGGAHVQRVTARTCKCWPVGSLKGQAVENGSVKVLQEGRLKASVAKC